jgi:hypothetical protein
MRLIKLDRVTPKSKQKFENCVNIFAVIKLFLRISIRHGASQQLNKSIVRIRGRLNPRADRLVLAGIVLLAVIKTLGKHGFAQ